MSASKTVNHGPGSSQGNSGPGSSQGNSGPGSSQGNGGPGPSQGIGSPGCSQESGVPGSSQESGGQAPSQEINSPPSSQEISVPGPSRRNTFVVERTPPDYVLAIEKFEDLLSSPQWAGRHGLRKSNAFNHIFELDDSDDSSEDENMRDHEFMREVESCQKLRVKILLELYKNMEGAPHSVWRTFQDEQTDGDDLNPSR